MTRLPNRTIKVASPNKIATKLVDGLEFAEGPLWHPDGFLLVSDTPANCIKKITVDGKVEIFLANSGCINMEPHANPEKIGSNGLKWQNVGKDLIFCRQGLPSIALYDGVSIQTLTDKFNERPYNSPNDLVLGSDGSIYFSDPPYGVEGEKLSPEFRQPLAGVYVLKNGKVDLLFSELNYPNGVCLSPDEKYLYISSNHPDEPFIYKLSLKSEDNHFTVFTPTNADGILSDKQGNVYTASGKYIFKFSPEGKKVASYFVGEATSNLTWGGANMKDLYITCYHSVWFIPDVLA